MLLFCYNYIIKYRTYSHCHCTLPTNLSSCHGDNIIHYYMYFNIIVLIIIIIIIIKWFLSSVLGQWEDFMKSKTVQVVRKCFPSGSERECLFSSQLYRLSVLNQLLELYGNCPHALVPDDYWRCQTGRGLAVRRCLLPVIYTH